MSSSPRPRHIFIQLISLSWFEFICSVVFSMALSAYLVTVAINRDGALQAYTQTLSTSIKTSQESNALYTHSEQLTTAINGSQLVGDATIFFVWALIGLLLYGLTNALIHLIGNEVGLLKRLSLFPSNRRFALRSTFTELSLHLGAMIVLLGFATAFRYVLFPQFLALIFGVFVLPISHALLSAVLGIGALILSMHVAVVLVRIMLLRTRVFFTKYSIVD